MYMTTTRYIIWAHDPELLIWMWDSELLALYSKVKRIGYNGVIK